MYVVCVFVHVSGVCRLCVCVLCVCVCVCVRDVKVDNKLTDGSRWYTCNYMLQAIAMHT